MSGKRGGFGSMRGAENTGEWLRLGAELSNQICMPQKKKRGLVRIGESQKEREGKAKLNPVSEGREKLERWEAKNSLKESTFTGIV